MDQRKGPPESRRRTGSWQRNLAALWIAQMLSIVGFSFAFPFIPLYVQTMGVSDPAEAARWAGAIVGASAIPMAIAQPIWGNLADRYGRKQMVVRSMLGGGIMLFLMGFAASPEQLLLLRLLQGSITGTVAASNALIATSTPRHRLGFALGLMQVAVFLGNSIGPLLGGVIADTFGYRVSFYAAGVALAIGGLTVVGLVREDFTRPAAGERRLGVLAESRSLLAISALPMLISVIFLINVSGVIVSPILSLFIAELSGGENAATMAGIALGATGAVSAASALIIGRLSDRIGHSVVLTTCMLGAAICYFPQALVQGFSQLLILRMLLGVFIGGLLPSANALLAGAVPQERRGAAFGLTATFTAMSHAIGPISGAAIASQFGMRSVFLATGVMFALAFGWTRLGLRRFERHHPRLEADLARAKTP